MKINSGLDRSEKTMTDIEGQVGNSIQRYAKRIKSNYLFHKPDITRHLLKNCRKYFVEGVREEDVLVLLDTTLGTSGKRGMALTNQALYALSKKIGSQQIALSDIQKVDIKMGVKGVLFINDREFFQYSPMYEKELNWFKAQLQDIYAVFNTRERDMRLARK